MFLYIIQNRQKMEKNITFEYLPVHGDPATVGIEIVFPDFEEYTDEVVLNGQRLPITITVEDQIMEYLDEMDKSDIMAKYDMEIIMDYHITPPPVDEMEDFKTYLYYWCKVCGIGPDMLMAVIEYAANSKTIFGCGKTNIQKLADILDGLNLCFRAKTAAYGEAVEMLRGNYEKPAGMLNF